MQNYYKLITEHPPWGSLGYIVAIAKLNDKHDRSAPSDHHWKILKCRMIIFSTSSILACPEKRDAKQVHIVFNKSGDDYDKLNSLFLKFSLSQEGSIKSTTPEIYQLCFEYTMNAKIAPIWNVVGYSYLINGRDFLTEKDPQDGVKYSVITNETETILEIKPVRIRFLRSEEDYQTGEWIRVLPSLNKAVVENFYNCLPGGGFKSYKDLRRHWKNIHGYRLPEVESPYYTVRFWRGDPLTYPKICITRSFPIITPMPKPEEHGYRLPEVESPYYTVRFWRGDPLTYPKICITRSFPIITPMPKPEEKTVVSKFLACIKSKMPLILGQPINIKGIYESKATPIANERLPDTQAVSLCTPTQYICR